MVAFLRRSGRNASRKIGRRGAVLLVLGTMYILLGVGYFPFSYPPGNPDVQDITYAFPLLLTGSMAVWGGVFFAVGVLSSVTAFWPPDRESWGFMLQAGFTAVWAVMGVFTMFVGGDRGWIVAAIFAALAALVLIVSGMRGVNDEPA